MEIEIMAGENISRAAKKACEIAKKNSENVSFKFNEIPVSVYPESYYLDIVKIYYCLCDIHANHKTNK